MKTIYHLFLAALVSQFLTDLSAKADLTQATDPSFGPNSLTIDTTTGLGWLELRASDGLSHDQALADTAPGGPFEGYRFATMQEVFGLWDSAGIPGPGFYPLSTPGISTLFSLLGTTGTFNGRPGLIASSGTSDGSAGPPDDYLYVQPAIYVTMVNGDPEYSVNAASAGNEIGSSPDLANWLVKDVPEPSSFFILSIGSLVLIAHWRRKAT